MGGWWISFSRTDGRRLSWKARLGNSVNPHDFLHALSPCAQLQANIMNQLPDKEGGRVLENLQLDSPGCVNILLIVHGYHELGEDWIMK